MPVSEAPRVEVPQPAESPTPVVPSVPSTPIDPTPATPADPAAPADVPPGQEPATPVVPEPSPQVPDADPDTDGNPVSRHRRITVVHQERLDCDVGIEMVAA
jgi:hypothetical protein